VLEIFLGLGFLIILICVINIILFIIIKNIHFKNNIIYLINKIIFIIIESINIKNSLICVINIVIFIIINSYNIKNIIIFLINIVARQPRGVGLVIFRYVCLIGLLGVAT